MSARSNYYRKQYRDKDEHTAQFATQVQAWSKEYNAGALPRKSLWEDLIRAGSAMIHDGVNGAELTDVLDGIIAKSNGQFPLFVNCLVQKVDEAPKDNTRSKAPSIEYMAQCMAFARQAHSLYSRPLTGAQKAALSLVSMQKVPNHNEYERQMLDAMGKQLNDEFGEMDKKTSKRVIKLAHGSSNDVYRGRSGGCVGWNKGKQTSVDS